MEFESMMDFVASEETSGWVTRNQDNKKMLFYIKQPIGDHAFKIFKMQYADASADSGIFAGFGIRNGKKSELVRSLTGYIELFFLDFVRENLDQFWDESQGFCEETWKDLIPNWQTDALRKVIWTSQEIPESGKPYLFHIAQLIDAHHEIKQIMERKFWERGALFSYESSNPRHMAINLCEQCVLAKAEEDPFQKEFLMAKFIRQCVRMKKSPFLDLYNYMEAYRALSHQLLPDQALRTAIWKTVTENLGRWVLSKNNDRMIILSVQLKDPKNRFRIAIDRDNVDDKMTSFGIRESYNNIILWEEIGLIKNGNKIIWRKT